MADMTITPHAALRHLEQALCGVNEQGHTKPAPSKALEECLTRLWHLVLNGE